MAIYIISFIASTLFFYEAVKLDNKRQRWFMLLLAILPVAMVAGVRDDNIGTDVLVYGKDCFLDAAQSRWYSEIDFSWMIRMEPGYLLLNYVVSRFTSSYNVFFGILMALQMFFVMKALIVFKNRMPVWLALLVYYFSYYNISLNQMRQSVACAIVLFACTYAYRRKLIPFLIVVALACTFHISAFVAFVIYPLFIVLRKTQSYKMMWTIVVMGVVMALLVQKSVDVVLETLGLNADYAHYFLAFSLIVMVVATQARELIGNDAERIMNYFVTTQIFALPFICAHLNKTWQKVIGPLGMCCYIAYWYYMFIYNGFQETYPYSSYILKQWL